MKYRIFWDGDWQDGDGIRACTPFVLKRKNSEGMYKLPNPSMVTHSMEYDTKEEAIRHEIELINQDRNCALDSIAKAKTSLAASEIEFKRLKDLWGRRTPLTKKRL